MKGKVPKNKYKRRPAGYFGSYIIKLFLNHNLPVIVDWKSRKLKQVFLP